MRVWDLLFFDGSRTMFAAALALIKMNEKALLEAESAAEVFNVLSTLPSKADDAGALIAGGL